MSRAELVANMTPLNYPGKLSTGRFHYGLDTEEREIVARNWTKMNKQEIWDLLEKKRFQELKNAAVNLQGDLLV